MTWKTVFQGLLQSLWTITVQYHSKEVLRGWLSKWQSLYIINSYMRSQGEFPLAPPSRTTVVLGAVKLNCHRAIAEVDRVYLKMNELCSIYRDKRTIKVFFTIGWKKTKFLKLLLLGLLQGLTQMSILTFMCLVHLYFVMLMFRGKNKKSGWPQLGFKNQKNYLRSVDRPWKKIRYPHNKISTKNSKGSWTLSRTQLAWWLVSTAASAASRPH